VHLQFVRSLPPQFSDLGKMASKFEIEEKETFVNSSVELDVMAPGDLPEGFEFVCKMEGKMHTVKVVSELVNA